MIKIHDNKVPFHVQQSIYYFILNSSFKIKGWEDRDDVDIAKSDLHSNWSIDDLKNSKLYPYIADLYSFDRFDKCIVNLTQPSNYYFTHTHGDDTTVLLYYANLEWRDGWAGETMFYDDNRVSTQSYDYTPGRILQFDGKIPHTIRPQSIIGPSYRFTVSCFFRGENSDINFNDK
tara:strand:- start:355 stop:879 length:525 start_codon:yes stop_codon:yes gene_type:complete